MAGSRRAGDSSAVLLDARACSGGFLLTRCWRRARCCENGAVSMVSESQRGAEIGAHSTVSTVVAVVQRRQVSGENLDCLR